MNITRRTFLAGAVAGVGMETARAAGTGPSAGAEAPKGAPNVTFGVLSDVHLERRGDEDTLLSEQTRPVFEQHYPGMSHAFPGGHRMNDYIVTHTLLPYIRGLNVI